MLNTALARAAHRATHDVLICVVTDGAGSDGETVRLVTQLCAHNDAFVVLVRDPLEAELPDAGRLVMAEADRQLEVDTSESVLRRRYAEDSRRRLADPPALGWYVVAGAIALVAGRIAWRSWRRWRAAAYRRAALAELDDIHARAEDPGGRGEAPRELALLVKRTALAAHGDRTTGHALRATGYSTSVARSHA